ncbi:MAG: hypothetical protein R3F59_16525 [Myxococcota bacterium]
MPLRPELLDSIRRVVDEGDVNHAGVVARIVDEHWQALGLSAEPSPADAPVLDALEAAVADAFAAQAAKAWPAVTDNDRLRVAFAALQAQGIDAFGPAGWDTAEAQAVAVSRSLALEGLGPPVGYVAFHRQDVWSAQERGGLGLGFGSFVGDTPEDGVAVGRAAATALRDAGLTVVWDGTARQRLVLAGFTWRARLPRMVAADLQDFLDGWTLALRTLAPWPGDEAVFET